MKAVLLWVVGGLLLCLIVGILCHIMRHRNRPAQQNTKPVETADDHQQALAQLRRHREDMTLACYRQDCAALFSGISGGIQVMLAQEALHGSRDSMLCPCLADAAEDEHLRRRIASRKKRPEAVPVSAEEEASDPNTIQEIIRVEKLGVFSPVIQIAWDTLLDRLLPCIEELVKSAEGDREEECCRLLVQLRQILADYGIYPVWYHDDVVQNNPAMQWDFLKEACGPVPTLYYREHGEYIRVGVPGCIGEKTEQEI